MVDRRFQELCEFAEAARSRQGVPGVSLGLSLRGVRRLKGFGAVSVENPLPVTPAAFFQAGSITKPFVGALAMKLVAKGRLSLREPLSVRILPELRLRDERAKETVNLWHLLTHTAGWEGNYFDDRERGDQALARYVEGMAKLPQFAPPGKLWTYNNSGYNLIGRLIEVASGLPFEEAMERLLFRPLGIREAFFFPEDVMARRFAVGHDKSPSGPKVAHPWALGRSLHPAGGLITTARALLRFAEAHLPGGELAAGPFRMLAEGQSQGGCGIKAVGLCWRLAQVGGEKAVYHGGGTNGQASLLFFLPRKRFVLSVLTNMGSGRNLAFELLEKALELYLGIRFRPVPKLKVPAGRLREYAGIYKSRLDDIRVTLSGKTLKAAVKMNGVFPREGVQPMPSSPSFPLEFCGKDQVAPVGAPGLQLWGRGDFIRDANRKIRFLRFGGYLHERTTKNQARG